MDQDGSHIQRTGPVLTVEDGPPDPIRRGIPVAQVVAGAIRGSRHFAEPPHDQARIGGARHSPIDTKNRMGQVIVAGGKPSRDGGVAGIGVGGSEDHGSSVQSERILLGGGDEVVPSRVHHVVVKPFPALVVGSLQGALLRMRPGGSEQIAVA